MYYSLRLTPEFLDISNCEIIFSKIIDVYKVNYSALCYEVLDKYGEPCKPHYHFNFLAENTKKSNIQHWLKQFGVKGSKCYALSDPSSVTPERWWRYTMKENLLSAILPPDLPSIYDLTLLAKEERKQSIRYNLQKRVTEKKRATLFEKMELLMLKTPNKFMTGTRVFKFIISYYMDNNLSININTVKGYTNLYLLKSGNWPLDDFVAHHYP